MVFFPCGLFLILFFRQIIIVDTQVLIAVAIVLGIAFVLTNIVHWGESLQSRHRKRFQREQEREGDLERDLRRGEERQLRQLEKLEKVEKKEHKLSKDIVKALSKLEGHYLKAHKSLLSSLHGDPDAIYEHEREVSEIKESILPLITLVRNDYLQFEEEARGIVSQIRVSREELGLIKRSSDVVLSEQIYARKLGEGFEQVELKGIREDLRDTELVKHLEERVQERFKAAYRLCVDAMNRLTSVLDILEQLRVKGSFVHEERLDALKFDYGSLSGSVTELLRSTHGVSKRVDELTNEARSIEKKQKDIEKVLEDRSKEQAKVAESVAKAQEREEHIRT